MGISSSRSSRSRNADMSSSSSSQDSAHTTLVDESIKEHKVVIFSKTYCPYCTKAKKLFHASYPNTKPVVYELDKRDDGGLIQDYLLAKTGQRTVPNIFINEEHIGGSDDLAKLERSGKLSSLLASEKTVA